jgi:hypothetical protein
VFGRNSSARASCPWGPPPPATVQSVCVCVYVRNEGKDFACGSVYKKVRLLHSHILSGGSCVSDGSKAYNNLNR